MDQRLIGPGVVEGRGHVYVPIHQDKQWPMKTGPEEKDNETWRTGLVLMGQGAWPQVGGQQELPGAFRAPVSQLTDSDLNWPDAMLSPVKRLFLASRRFSRSFLSNFCNRKGHGYTKKRCSRTGGSRN